MKKKKTNIVVRVVGKYSKKIEKSFTDVVKNDRELTRCFNEFFRTFKNLPNPLLRGPDWDDWVKCLINMIHLGKIQYKKANKQALIKLLNKCNIVFTENEVIGENLASNLERLEIAVYVYINAVYDLAKFHAFDTRSPIYQAKMKREEKKKLKVIEVDQNIITDLLNPQKFKTWFVGNLDRRAREEGWSREQVRKAMDELRGVTKW